MIRYIDEVSESAFDGKTCLVRVDLNVPENSPAGEECDSFRIWRVIPALRFLLEKGARLIILSHRGRFGKQPLSLDSFTHIFSEELNTPVTFISRRGFSQTRAQMDKIDTRVILLENLRFFRGEQENNADFAKLLASFGDIYINDAFAASHRAHASIVSVPRLLPAFGGLLLKDELVHLSNVLEWPQHPFVVIIGGAKIRDKLGVIKQFLNTADSILLGGGPANTFLTLQSKELFNSEKIVVPIDFKTKDNKHLDIGPRTVNKYSEIIKSSHTVIWNGPMGMFEEEEFSEGTKGIWEAIRQLANENKKSRIIVGGGETIASLATLMPTDAKRIYADNISVDQLKNQRKSARLFLSTGGGAMLKFLAGEQLPGIKALEN